jgi:aspartate racemase
MKKIGLIGGMSWESTAVYYRLLNEIACERLGGLHSAQLLMWSFDFAEIEKLQAAGDWDGATERMTGAARVLERGGADCVVICTNTMHKMADAVSGSVSIPLIHIADGTGAAVRQAGCRRPILLATRYTMEQDFYRKRLEDMHQVGVVVPDEAGRELVHRVIYDELCRGIVLPGSKAAYVDLVDRMRRTDGADGVILGCTEITLLVSQDDFTIPVFDTTLLHARAAFEYAHGG